MKERLEHSCTIADDFVVTRRFDSYVCLDLDIDKSETDLPPLYWSLAEPKFSLVEIGIARSSGRLLSVTVVLYKGVLHRKKSSSASLEKLFGMPVFDLGLWVEPKSLDVKRDHYRVSGKCRLELGSKELRVNLFSEEISYTVGVSDQLMCEFNPSGELCAVSVSNLSSLEMSALGDYIKFHRSV
jgi:hypothetical protein